MQTPVRTLSSFDAVAIIIGIVIGAGIFKTPSMVAAHSGSMSAVVLFWIFGGVISLVGALCYAELATAYPDAGGDYHFLRRAFGNRTAFLFAWARMTVIQTGSIAMLAFILGDYTAAALGTNAASSWQYAALVVIVLTLLNTAGIRQGTRAQNVLTGMIVLGLLFVVVAGLSLSYPALPTGSGPAVPGKAMVFVLLTYGGWNEAAYISAEIRQPKRNMTRVLLISIAIITAIYVAANLVFLKGLGLAGTARSETVAADLMRLVMGENGARFISGLIVLAAVSTMNAVIITGARTNYALGRDFPLLRPLGKWQARSSAPVNALLLQCAIAIALVALGALTRSGFTTMVEYTAPVFWFFFLLVGISLFVLRRKDPGRERPFRVPLYPLTPVLFCIFCVYMFQASFTYAGIGAVAGLGVLLAGVPVMELTVRGEGDF
ncbi:MAG: amino acid permease [Nitrospirae bacterium GWD2_57_9]|nr:MAG: amino acid permease [Nitrospirae bacterium GWD2_57_9]OGW45769.1 MAG: amino acid permease [Nitrospirae bacterium GWC2_57_9]